MFTIDDIKVCSHTDGSMGVREVQFEDSAILLADIVDALHFGDESDKSQMSGLVHVVKLD